MSKNTWKGIGVNPVAWYLVSRHAMKLAHYKSQHESFRVNDLRRLSLIALGFIFYNLLMFFKKNKGSIKRKS